MNPISAPPHGIDLQKSGECERQAGLHVIYAIATLLVRPFAAKSPTYCHRRRSGMQPNENASAWSALGPNL